VVKIQWHVYPQRHILTQTLRFSTQTPRLYILQAGPDRDTYFCRHHLTAKKIMKTKLLFTAALFLLAVAGHSQFSYYKVQNGSKTPLKEGESVTIPLDDNNAPLANVLMEIDVKAFRTAHKYDLIAPTFCVKESDGSLRQLYYVDFVFDSQLNLKKYASVKTLKVYLFGTPDVTADNYNLYLTKPKVTYDDALLNYIMLLGASYITGTEDVYDDGVFRERNIYSKRETISKPGSPLIRFEMTPGTLVSEKHRRLIVAGYASMDGQMSLASVTKAVSDEIAAIKKFVTSIPMVGTSENYPNISESMQMISDARKNEITNETDKAKALALLEQWSKEYKHLLVSGKGKDILKDMNKQLKGKTDVQSRMDVFKTVNP